MTTKHLPLLIELDADPEMLRHILGRARDASEAQEFWDPFVRTLTPTRWGSAGGSGGAVATETS